MRTHSKSRYMSGLQCLRLFYIEMTDPDRIPKPDIPTQFTFDLGDEVGAAARERFPGGVLIDAYPLEKSVEDTRKALKDGQKVIYEAAFEHEGVHVKVDVLRKKEDGTFDIFEVKQTSGMKPKYIPDVAIQKYVVSGSGVNVNRTYLMHLNKEYVHPDQGELFQMNDCTDPVEEYQEEIPGKLANQKEILKEESVPEMSIGPHCTNPHPCALKDECWEHIPEVSIFNIPRLNKKWELYEQGNIKLEQLPAEFSLTDNQERFVRAWQAEEPTIDQAGIKAMLDDLKEPIYYMDFETINWAIPHYSNSSPFNQIPFQWSLHITRNGDIEHKEFLWKGTDDPRPEFLRTLLEAVGETGSVVVYFDSFEKTRLKELARAFPEHKDAIGRLIERVWDLFLIFKNYYCHPRAKGSNSIKKVLPALCPDISYDDLAVQEGRSASAIFAKMIAKEDGPEKDQMYTDLLEYCKMDTLAMVELLDVVKRDVK